MSSLIDEPPYPWQAAQWQWLNQAFSQDKLAHALLFVGPEDLGKMDFALAFAAKLLCLQGNACGSCKSCLLRKAQTHPDFIVLQPDGQSIKIEQVRKLSLALQQTVQCAPYRVVIINPADAMNIAAANALLKTLEEPSAQTILILVSAHSHRLPVTISSRCQRQHFSLPKQPMLQQWLQAQHDDAIDFATIAWLSQGLPLRAQSFLNTEQETVEQAVLQDIVTYLPKPEGLLQLAQNCAKHPVPSVLSCLQLCLESLIKRVVCGQETAFTRQLSIQWPKISHVDLFKLLDRLYGCKRLLQTHQGMNAQLVFENILFHWQQALLR